jgi:hypothetical protein
VGSNGHLPSEQVHGRGKGSRCLAGGWSVFCGVQGCVGSHSSTRERAKVEVRYAADVCVSIRGGTLQSS